MRCKNVYAFPLDSEFTRKRLWRRVLWQIEDIVAGSHRGSLVHAIDFMVPSGTPVYAAARGVVVWTKSDSWEGGVSKKYWHSGNRVVIRHSRGEYTAYEHLKHGGVLVKVGQRVKEGQRIGLSGRTGVGFLAHLHFEVFTKPTKDQSEGTTLEVRFKKLGTIRDGNL